MGWLLQVVELLNSAVFAKEFFGEVFFSLRDAMFVGVAQESGNDVVAESASVENEDFPVLSV